MTERTGRAFLIISSLLIPLFFAMACCRSPLMSLEKAGSLAFGETAISLFVFLAFPLSVYLLRRASKLAWMYFALTITGLFFALELVACVFALMAARQGLID